MSASVGWATLQIIPSAKGFTKALQKEIRAPLSDVGSEAGASLGTTMSRHASAPVSEGISKAISKGARNGAKDGAKDVETHLGGGVRDALRSGFKSGFKGLFSLSQEQGKSMKRSIAFGIAGGLIRGAAEGFEALQTGAKHFFEFLSEGGQAAGKAAFQAISTAITGAATTVATGGLNLLVGALVAVAAAIPVVIAGFLALAPVLGIVGGLAGSLFTIIAGGIGSVGVFALAFRGLGKAFQEFAKDGKVSDETLKSISKNARKFVLAFEGAHKALSKIRKIVQDNFFAGLDVQLKNLIKAWKAPLKGMLGGLATDFNGFIKQITTALAKPEFIANMKTAFAGFGDFIERIGKAMGPLTDAFGRLAAGSVPFLKILGDSLAGIIEKFSLWVKKADETGALKTFMQDAAQAFKDIWAIGGLVFGIIGDIIKILFPSSKQASAGVFTGVRNVLQEIKNWLGDPKNQQGIKDFIQGLIDGFKSFIDKVQNEWIPKAKEMFDKVGEFINRVDEWGDRIDAFKTTVGKAMAVISGLLYGLAGPISFAVGLFGQLPSGAEREGKRTTSAFGRLPSLIRAAIGPAGGILYNIGVDIASGLARGMRSNIGAITAAGLALGAAAATATRKAVNSNSPSKVFMAIGGDVAEGMAIGITRGTPKVTRAVGVMTAVPDASSNWGPRPAHPAPAAAPVMAPTINLHNTRATAAQVSAVLERQAILARLGRAR